MITSSSSLSERSFRSDVDEVNFFLTINAALFGFSFNHSYAGNEPDMAVAGMVFSVLWLYFGAVDNRLVDLYRAHVETDFRLIKKALGAQSQPAASEARPTRAEPDPFELVSFVGDTSQTRYYTADTEHPDGRTAEVGSSWSAFRWRRVSATELATLFPFVFLIAWVIRLLAAA